MPYFVSISQLLELSESVDAEDLVCDEEELGDFLELGNKSAANVSQISAELCGQDQDTVVEITQYLLEQLDIADIITQVRCSIHASKR